MLIARYTRYPGLGSYEGIIVPDMGRLKEKFQSPIHKILCELALHWQCHRLFPTMPSPHLSPRVFVIRKGVAPFLARSPCRLYVPSSQGTRRSQDLDGPWRPLVIKIFSQNRVKCYLQILSYVCSCLKTPRQHKPLAGS